MSSESNEENGNGHEYLALIMCLCELIKLLNGRRMPRPDDLTYGSPNSVFKSLLANVCGLIPFKSHEKWLES